ncbi:putative holin-like toxin, partial [Lactococcus petauri]
MSTYETLTLMIAFALL